MRAEVREIVQDEVSKFQNCLLDELKGSSSSFVELKGTSISLARQQC
jgi:hypothetical protein